MHAQTKQNLDRLKQGFLFWNKYRDEANIPTGMLDLSDLEIDGRYWRFNELKNANLGNCLFRKTTFRDIDFLDIDFSNADFSHASFINVHFSHCHFSGSSFEKALFQKTAWYHSDLKEVDFTQAKQLETLYFYRCTFQKNALHTLNLPEEIFEECIFEK